MSLVLEKREKEISAEIKITGSKSESNRLLILQQFYSNLKIENLSNSDDTQVLQKALQSIKGEVNIGHAGTAMRFLTAFYAAKEGADVVLTGSRRMKDRPMKILVDALKSLGAEISYMEKEGYPPLHIRGKEISKSKVVIDGNVSSQYISALLLIASSLKEGLELKFAGKITSIPYIQMTLGLLHEVGISHSWVDDTITIEPKNEITDTTVVVESDWSSASYYYSIAALSSIAKIKLTSYKENSLQGDSVLATIYEKFGVETTFLDNSVILEKKENFTQPELVEVDLIKAPDIAQTIAVTCFGLGVACNLTGLHTLKIKETDRLVALQNELQKLGATISITENSLHLQNANNIHHNISIKTYDDHRMAMAFAPLFTKVPIQIEDAAVVSKSYPTFWEDLNTL